MSSPYYQRANIATVKVLSDVGRTVRDGLQNLWSILRPSNRSSSITDMYVMTMVPTELGVTFCNSVSGFSFVVQNAKVTGRKSAVLSASS